MSWPCHNQPLWGYRLTTHSVMVYPSEYPQVWTGIGDTPDAPPRKISARYTKYNNSADARISTGHACHPCVIGPGVRLPRLVVQGAEKGFRPSAPTGSHTRERPAPPNRIAGRRDSFKFTN